MAELFYFKAIMGLLARVFVLWQMYGREKLVLGGGEVKAQFEF